MFKYQQDDYVSFDNGVIQGKGIIVGVSHMPQAIIGAGYIIKPDDIISNPTYPYTHFVCFENHITPLN
jgi:hypothetical protein